MTEGMDFQPHSKEAFYVIFDDGPGPVSGRFIECETEDGRGVGVGEWEDYKPYPDTESWCRLGPFYDAGVVEEYRSALYKIRSALDSLYYAPPEGQRLHTERMEEALREVGLRD